MKIVELLQKKQDNLVNNKPITIAFLGDSVTQGCFEVYLTSETSLETVFDSKHSYSSRIKEIIQLLYPSVQVNIINSGISGDNAGGGVKRLDRDILSYNPDLCVVSFGLNDACCSSIEEYKESLREIFCQLNKKGIEAIFLTENAMCVDTSCHLKDDLLIGLSKDFSKVQNDGLLKQYFMTAKALCEEYNVKVCDLYSVWEKMINSGIKTTELLANYLNHPIRLIHYYIAIKIIEKIFEI